MQHLQSHIYLENLSSLFLGTSYSCLPQEGIAGAFGARFTKGTGSLGSCSAPGTIPSHAQLTLGGKFCTVSLLPFAFPLLSSCLFLNVICQVPCM